MSTHASEIARGQRFEFGENWLRFLARVDDARVAQAERSLQDMLAVVDLAGKTFLDLGCGSGLLSLAARRLGAHVLSIDYDPKSVACTEELKRRYRPADAGWTIQEGSALDRSYLESLGRFDVVYSWGVLHHTGAMWEALGNVAGLVAEGGKLFIAIYNDQGRASHFWRWIKRLYNSLPRQLRFLVVWPVFVRQWLPPAGRDLLRGKPFDTWRSYGAQYRAMTPWENVLDWVGGYPFEVAKPEEIFDYYRAKGFTLMRLITNAGGHGCNEYVFAK